MIELSVRQWRNYAQVYSVNPAKHASLHGAVQGCTSPHAHTLESHNYRRVIQFKDLLKGCAKYMADL